MPLDPRQPRYVSKRSDDPVTMGELGRWMERHERMSDEVHRDLAQLIRQLDDRTDKLATRMAVIFALGTAGYSILLLLAPIVRSLIGLP